MTGLPLEGLLSVEDVAGYLSLSTKTIRRMISRGELVSHRVGRSVRVNATCVTSLVAGSVTSAAVETIAMTEKKHEPATGAPRLYRQRGRSRVWTALVNNQEVPLGTHDEKEARRRLAGMTQGAAARDRDERRGRAPWRVYPDPGRDGFVVKYYDAAGRRRLHRVPSGTNDAQQAEAYAQDWFARHVAGQSSAVSPVRGVTLRPGMTFEQFSRAWTSGDLARMFPDHVRAKATAKHDLQRLTLYVFPIIGHEVMSAFEGRHGLDLVERVQMGLPPVSSKFTRSSRRHVLQAIHRTLVLATYPGRLISANPLPKGFLPKVDSTKSKSYVYPDEDAKLMACRAIPVALRLVYGILAREGMRVSELLDLKWSDVDLERGIVVLDENKTDDPRSWALDPGVAEALRRWRKVFAWGPSPDVRVFRAKDNTRIDKYELALGLRESLARAGVSRPQIFERSPTRLPLRAHDLRASFVTVHLALGKSEAWITDRTGHRSSQMVYLYKRAARAHAELNLGAFLPLHGAIPELSDVGSGAAG